MIVEYHRPTSLDEALRLLARTEIKTKPLGGGTVLNRPSDETLSVVDLQTLGLDEILKQGNTLTIGSRVTLQGFLEYPQIPHALMESIRLETSFNLRQMATVAGTLVSADGRSPFATVMLALDAMLEWRSLAGDQQIGLGELFLTREEQLAGKLITWIRIPLNVRIAFEYVARTPADRPIMCVAVAQWPSGRTRVALGGMGVAPLLAMDGPEADGAEIAAYNAYSQAGDEWASAEYRQKMAEVLTLRCLAKLSEVHNA